MQGWVAETQLQLGVISLTVVVAGEAQWETRPPFDVVISSGQQQVVLRMPCEVFPNQSGTITTTTSTLRLRALPQRPSYPPTPHAYLSHPHLTTTHPATLNCNTCLSPLIISPPPSEAKYIAMPSEHWEELVDAWMCHADQRLSESVQVGREGLEEGRRIGEGDVRVGEGWVAWDAQRVVPGAIQMVEQMKMVSRARELRTSFRGGTERYKIRRA